MNRGVREEGVYTHIYLFVVVSYSQVSCFLVISGVVPGVGLSVGVCGVTVASGMTCGG